MISAVSSTKSALFVSSMMCLRRCPRPARLSGVEHRTRRPLNSGLLGPAICSSIITMDRSIHYSIIGYQSKKQLYLGRVVRLDYLGLSPRSALSCPWFQPLPFSTLSPRETQVGATPEQAWAAQHEDLKKSATRSLGRTSP